MAERDTQKRRQKRRRRRGEGSIRYRADEERWEASIAVGDGTRRSHYTRTEREGLRWLAEARRLIEQGQTPPDERLSVAAYLASWLDSIESERERGTMERHREIVRLHINPALGHIKLAKLTPLQVQTFYTKLRERGLSAATVVRIHAVLHKALKDAEMQDIVPRNVCDRVRLPKVKRPDIAIYTPEQARAFLDAIAGNRLAALYLLAPSTGLRMGELLGLQWQDIDLTCGILRVRRSLQSSRHRNAPYLKQPKTEAGKRELKLTPQVVEMLRGHRQRQLTDRLHAGAAWQGRGGESDFVFCNEIGLPLSRHAVYMRFVRIGQKAGLPHISFHGLRHTFTTLLRSAGVPAEVVSAMLGHADIATTLGVYAHVLPSMQDEAVAAIARILAG